MEITSQCVVALTWVLKDTLGETLDELTDPVDFLVGGTDLLERIEEALQGHEPGDRLDLHLEPEEAFGDYDPNLVCFEARSLFPDGVEPGLQTEGLPEGAITEGMPENVLYTVTEVYPNHIVLDGNHPLAGIGLRMHLTLLDVRAATESEVEAGSVGEPIFRVQTSAPPDEPIH